MNELGLVSVDGGEFLDWLSKYLLLRKYCFLKKSWYLLELVWNYFQMYSFISLFLVRQAGLKCAIRDGCLQYLESSSQDPMFCRTV
jgi:hypothetical protein